MAGLGIYQLADDASCVVCTVRYARLQALESLAFSADVATEVNEMAAVVADVDVKTKDLDKQVWREGGERGRPEGNGSREGEGGRQEGRGSRKGMERQ